MGEDQRKRYDEDERREYRRFDWSMLGWVLWLTACSLAIAWIASIVSGLLSR